MNCSDAHVAHVCSQCGGLISVYAHTGDYASSYGQSGICTYIEYYNSINYTIVVTAFISILYKNVRDNFALMFLFGYY